MKEEYLKRFDLEVLRLLIRRKEYAGPFISNLKEIVPILIKYPEPKVLAEGLEKCPDISLKVIQIAGSAYYGGRHVRSLLHAVELLGVPLVCSIAASACMLSKTKLALKVKGFSAESYRNRAIALGMISRELAKKLNVRSAELQFMTGLFQESGYLLLALYAPALLQFIIEEFELEEDQDIEKAERKLMGFTHAEASGLLAQEYQMPPSVVQALTYHHNPGQADLFHQAEADIAHVASYLASELGFTLFKDAPTHDVDETTCLRLGIEKEEIDQLGDEIFTPVQDQAQLMAA